MSDVKRIDIKEFREEGYLQELNRQFLHPLGLALEVQIDDEGNEKLGGVWDYRKDDDGIYYDLENSDNDRKTNFKKKSKYVEEQRKLFEHNRLNKLGFAIEPID